MLALVGVAAVIVMVCGASAHAAPLGQIQEFATPTTGAAPNGIRVGPEGNLWFTEYGASKIGVIDPMTHAIEELTTTTPASGPFEIAAGPEGNLWFTEFHASKIGEINPSTHAIEEFPIPVKVTGEASHPFGITAGPDGNLWFTVAYTVGGSEPSASYIGEINPTTHAIAEFSTPSAKSFPAGITAGSEGNIWFTEGEASTVGRIGKINPTTHATEDFPFEASGEHGPGEITLGPEGDLWFTELIASKIGEINPSTHKINEFPTPTAGSTPLGITTGSEGNLWFTEQGASQVGRLNPTTGTIEEFPLANGSGPSGITPGHEGSVWFSDNGSSKIGTIGAGPTVVTKPASQLTPGSATLNATVNPNGVHVSNCKFEYGTTTAYGASAPCSPSPGSGTTPVAVSASLTHLSPGTTYDFRISASTRGGTSEGANETFKTPAAGPPVNCTDPATHQRTGYQGSPTTISGPGSWCYTGAEIAAPVTISHGANVLIEESTVDSRVEASGAGAFAICQSTVRSPVTISKAAGFVVIGDPGDDLCAANTLSSALHLVADRSAVEVAHNTLYAPLTVESTRGTGTFAEDEGAQIEGNTSYSSLACFKNKPIGNGGQPNVVYGRRSGQCEAPF